MAMLNTLTCMYMYIHCYMYKCMYNVCSRGTCKSVCQSCPTQNERHFIMQVLCETTQCTSEQVQVVALQNLCKIMSLYYQYMETYMGPALFAVSIYACLICQLLPSIVLCVAFLLSRILYAICKVGVWTVHEVIVLWKSWIFAMCKNPRIAHARPGW